MKSNAILTIHRLWIVKSSKFLNTREGHHSNSFRCICRSQIIVAEIRRFQSQENNIPQEVTSRLSNTIACGSVSNIFPETIDTTSFTLIA